MDHSAYIHPSTIVDHPCSIGERSKIWHFCHLMSGCRIGCDCTIGQNVMIAPDVIIGDRVKIQNNISIFSGVIIDDDVFLGPSCVFTNVINPRSFINRKDEFRTTRICKGASIGANATILCGHTIGEFAMVGAGSVVTKDIPPYQLAVGNPAQLIGYVCRCGCRLDVSRPAIKCIECGAEYRLWGDRLSPLEEVSQ